MASQDLERDSELNRKISADLRQRVQTSGTAKTDFGEEESYPRDTKKTGRFAWIWIVLIVLAIISLICIAFI